MSGNYILVDHRAVQCDDLMTWSHFFEDIKNRRVAETTIGESRVSTVFLGLDHSFGDGPRQLFETMVFGGVLADEQERCSTWDQAETQHEEMCERVRATP